MKTKLFYLFLTIFLISGYAYSADRSVTVKPKNSADAAIQLNTNYYALIIGNNNYKYFPKLKTPTADAVDVEKILKNKYGFRTKLLLDATRNDILSGINEFRKKLGQNDSLLIYYAGHGEFDKTADKAYWLPVDAQKDNPVDWIMADDITTNIKRITSRHILVVADSCYSGTLTRGVSIDLSSNGNRTEFLKKMIVRPSRTLMASGGNEPVADSGGGSHSVFARAFLTALRENDKGIFTAEEIFHGRIKEMVAGKSDQVPEYNNIKNSGHEGGDFIFQSGSDNMQLEEEKTEQIEEPTIAKLEEPLPSTSDKRRFIFYELTVLDKDTKLVWAKDTNIAGKSMSWNSANDYIKQLNMQRYAGFSDWRLPDIEELKTLVAYAQSQGVSKRLDKFFNEIGFKNAHYDYWSSTSDAASTTHGTGYAWFVRMFNGFVYTNPKNIKYYVWPVRSGQ